MATKVPELRVPAPLYDEALAFCNARLREDDRPLIDALPAGEPSNGQSCPCGVACGGRVFVDHRMWWRFHADGSRGSAKGDGHPWRFVQYFDNNAPDVATLPVRDESLTVPS